jgi:hypothetical protein
MRVVSLSSVVVQQRHRLAEKAAKKNVKVFRSFAFPAVNVFFGYSITRMRPTIRKNTKNFAKK